MKIFLCGLAVLVSSCGHPPKPPSSALHFVRASCGQNFIHWMKADGGVERSERVNGVCLFGKEGYAVIQFSDNNIFVTDGRNPDVVLVELGKARQVFVMGTNIWVGGGPANAKSWPEIHLDDDILWSNTEIVLW